MIVIISFYVLSKRFFLKCKRLSDAGVASMTKKEYGFAFFVKIHKVFKVNIWWMIYTICCSSLLFQILIIKNWVVLSLKSFHTLKYNCVVKTRKISSFHQVPWSFPKRPNVLDLQGTFRRLLGNQHKHWWFNE